MVMVEVMVVRLCPARVGMPCRGADILQLDQYRDAQLGEWAHLGYDRWSGIPDLSQ